VSALLVFSSVDAADYAATGLWERWCGNITTWQSFDRSGTPGPRQSRNVGRIQFAVVDIGQRRTAGPIATVLA
jgi:hypothetical protein